MCALTPNSPTEKIHLVLTEQKGKARVKLVGWLVVLKINVDVAIFQPYLDFEAGDDKSLKIQVERPGIKPRSSCSASQELNHSATAAPPAVSSVMMICVRDKLFSILMYDKK